MKQYIIQVYAPDANKVRFYNQAGTLISTIEKGASGYKTYLANAHACFTNAKTSTNAYAWDSSVRQIGQGLYQITYENDSRIFWIWKIC